MLAAGKQWHATCFVCTTCSVPFKESYYIHKDHPYCKKDYYRAMNLLCAKVCKFFAFILPYYASVYLSFFPV